MCLTPTHLLCLFYHNPCVSSMLSLSTFIISLSYIKLFLKNSSTSDTGHLGLSHHVCFVGGVLFFSFFKYYYLN